MRLKVIACDAQRREMCAAAARSRNRVDLEFMPATPEDELVVAIAQNAIDRVAAAPLDAVVLAYALCGSPVAGLESRRAPLVVPRAAGCGGFRAGKHGICFRSTGWSERGAFGKSNRDEAIAALYTTYRHSTYITTSPGGRPVMQEGAAEFQTAPLDSEVFDTLVSGVWDEPSFLVVPPGWRVIASPDGRSLGREPIA